MDKPNRKYKTPFECFVRKTYIPLLAAPHAGQRLTGVNQLKYVPTMNVQGPILCLFWWVHHRFEDQTILFPNPKLPCRFQN